MINLARYRRLRVLVHSVNQGRKRQAKKIDILCNDLVGAHRGMIRKIDELRFAANFYQSIIASRNLEDLLDTAGVFLDNEIGDAKIVFFLRQGDGFSSFTCKSEEIENEQTRSFESFFTSEVIEDICRYNRPCNLDEMMTMGLQVVPTMLNNLSAFAVPLFSCGNSIGFILIYRTTWERLQPEQADVINTISNGLARAILSCQTVYSKSE